MADDHIPGPKHNTTDPPLSGMDTRPAGRSEYTGMPWKIGTELLNNYVIEDVLGRGGMGAVYLVSTLHGDEQYAVKTLMTSALKDASSELMFLRELRTWSDLPDHPNLVSSRFFRTIEDYLVIFAEYVDGGTLDQWINRGKLAKTGRIIDLAIQISRGLQAAHEHGVIHQDIKPGNILMSRDGVGKITDFGIARALHAGGINLEISIGEGKLRERTGGITPAFCSPEQFMGEPITPQTDIWSLGLSILTIFTGGPRWTMGSVAPKLLERYLTTDRDLLILPVPDGLVDILKTCFEIDPGNRWPSTIELITALEDLYQTISGDVYDRPAPHLRLQRISRDVSHPRITERGISWDDPAIWLTRALTAAGLEQQDTAYLLPRESGTFKSQMLADLEVLDTAARLFSRAAAGNDDRIIRDLAALLKTKSIVHFTINDQHGALTAVRKSIQHLEYLTGTKQCHDLLPDLACSYARAGDLEGIRGKFKYALDLIDRATEILKNALALDTGHDHLGELSSVTLLRADILLKMGKVIEALSVFNAAIDILDRRTQDGDSPDLKHYLADAYSRKAVALESIGKPEDALLLIKKAIAIWEQNLYREGDRMCVYALAAGYARMGHTLNELNRCREALRFLEKSIRLWERLVYIQDQTNAANLLATSYFRKATSLGCLGFHDGAEKFCRKGILLLEHQIYQEGRNELYPELGRGYTHLARALRQIGDVPGTMMFYEKSMEIWRQLVDQRLRVEFRGDMAQTMVYQASGLRAMGELEKGSRRAEQAMEILRTEHIRTRRADLKKTLEWAETVFG